MNPRLQELMGRIRELEEEIEADLARRRAELHYTLENRKVRFEGEILARHRRLRTGLMRYVTQANLRSLVSAPFVYAVFFPLLLVDVATTLYQRVCFPLYGIPRVRRGDYVCFDRGHLAYLNLVEKINCTYCSYGNGVAGYVKQVAALTEQYWCPIKHSRRIPQPHSRYERFLDYGDGEGYRRELARLQRDFED